MGEYIKRKTAYPIARKVVDAVTNMKIPMCVLAYDIMDWIDEIPAVDVRPVVRGKWIKRRFSENVYGAECSVCSTTWDYSTNFCPNCGADMREDQTNE